MALRIQNNIAALYAHRNLTVADNAMTKSLERLSSGYRINRAADDAAGLSISQAFRADIASYKAASRNVSEANSVLQVAEGAIDAISGMLTRLKELATQASSANGVSNLDKINAEGNALLAEIDRIAAATEYAGSALLDGTFSGDFQVGARNVAANDRISVTIGTVSTTVLSLTTGQLAAQGTAQVFLATVDTAIGTLNGIRGDIGAAQNRMSYAAANLASTIENVTASESVIRDVDMAAEMVNFTKHQILLQAGTAMLAQANLAPQVVLQLMA